MKLILGDSETELKNIESESIDMVLTSPPYDNLRNYNNTNDWSFDKFQKIAKQLKRVLKKGGVIVWVVGDATINGSETGTSFKHALYFKENLGLKLHDTMIYYKDNPPPIGGNNRYYSSFEYMFVFIKGDLKKFNPIIIPRRNKHNDKRTSRVKVMNREKDGSFKIKQVTINENVKAQNVWKYVVSGGSISSFKEAHQHPAIFPEKLAHDHIISWTNENDTVLDPFMGSGTTGFMCKILNRSFIGIERVEKYYEICKKRLDYKVDVLPDDTDLIF